MTCLAWNLRQYMSCWNDFYVGTVLHSSPSIFEPTLPALFYRVQPCRREYASHHACRIVSVIRIAPAGNFCCIRDSLFARTSCAGTDQCTPLALKNRECARATRLCVVTVGLENKRITVRLCFCIPVLCTRLHVRHRPTNNSFSFGSNCPLVVGIGSARKESIDPAWTQWWTLMAFHQVPCGTRQLVNTSISKTRYRHSS